MTLHTAPAPQPASLLAPATAARPRLAASLLATLWGLVACGGGGGTDMPSGQMQAQPQLAMSPARMTIEAKGGSGGGGAPAPAPVPTPAPSPTPAPAPSAPASAPGGGARLPPSSTTDAAAWYFADISAVNTVGFAPDIDYTRLENMTMGGIPVGATRSATELIYNVSKKTPLTVTNIRIAGADPADFFIDPQVLATIESTVLPANKTAVEALPINFRPTAPGARTANVVFTSAAGVVQIAVSGVGLPTQPVISGTEPLTFFPDSAPASFIIQNTGGVTLQLQGIAIAGATPGAFRVSVANSGFGNCYAGVLIAPLAYCFLGIVEVDGAAAPASADLVITSNDPVHPVTDVPLSLVPLP